MEAQTPAEGIVKMKERTDSKWYKVPCKCGCDNDVSFIVQVDDFNITADFYCTTKTNYWRERFDLNYSGNWLVLNVKLFLNDWYNRLAVAWQAIVQGYVQTDASVILSPQQCLNFSETLKTAITDYETLVEARKAEFEAKNAIPESNK